MGSLQLCCGCERTAEVWLALYRRHGKHSPLARDTREVQGQRVQARLEGLCKSSHGPEALASLAADQSAWTLIICHQPLPVVRGLLVLQKLQGGMQLSHATLAP